MDGYADAADITDGGNVAGYSYLTGPRIPFGEKNDNPVVIFIFGEIFHHVSNPGYFIRK